MTSSSALHHPMRTSHHAASYRRRFAIFFLCLVVVVAVINHRSSAGPSYSPVSISYDKEYDAAHADLGKNDAGGLAVDIHTNPSGESKYCTMMNPMPTVPHASQICLGYSQGAVRSATAADAFVLVATVAESDLWDRGTCSLGHLSWMASIAVPMIVFVKSNATKSFRQLNNTWDESNNLAARGQQDMFRSLNPLPRSPGRFGSKQHRTVFRSILRDAWDAAQPQAEGSDREPSGGSPSGEPLCRGSEWIQRKQNGMSDLFLFESPNVGDEALSFAEVALRMSRVAEQASASLPADASLTDDDRIKMTTLDGVLSKAQYVIAVHDHAESWHAVHLVEQLRCTCMDKRRNERYRTLTSPSKAFLLQCMPLVMNETEALENVMHRAPRAAAANPEFVAYQRKNIGRSAALSRLFRSGMEYLFSVHRGDEVVVPQLPAAVVRDCCATFIVSREAILGLDTPQDGSDVVGGWRSFSAASGGVEAPQFWNSLRNKIFLQPSDAPQYFNEALEKEHDLRIGDLSMYLERFWRTLFGSGVYETQRDLAVSHCSDTTKIAFECPPFPVIRSVEDLEKDVQDGIASHRLTCEASFAAGNVFR